MAALLEEDILHIAPERAGGIPDLPASEVTDSLYGRAAQPVNHAAMAQHSRTGDAIKSAMPELVKGVGLARKGGNAPLEDPRQITVLASQAALDLRTEVRRGYTAKADVVKGISGDFLSQFGALRTALTTPSIGEQISQLFQGIPGGAEALSKSFTAGNLGIGSIYGFVPFDLLAPSRLIYPVYTVSN
jgi:hypothetical protein